MLNISETPEKCLVCGSTNVIDDAESGETVCSNCGYVYPLNMVDMGPEWRAFNLHEKRNKPRTGSPLNLTIHDQGLSSSISGQNRDYAGKSIKQDKLNQFYRLRKWNRRTKINSNIQRNLAKALGYMNQMANELNVPRSVTETAAIVYRQVIKKGGTRGRTINDLVAASLYVGCRMCNVSKSLTVISEAANISKKKAACAYRYLHDLLDQDIPSISTGKIISMLVNQLNRSGCVERVALDVLQVASELKITSGKSPSGMAAAAVYIGCCTMGEKVTQHIIAFLARVTEVTIRNRYKEMVERMELKVLV